VPDSVFDLAVVGAGILGLGCAFEEARRGKRVAVIDPAPESMKASWAAAGILVTRGARVFHSPFREFYVRSIRMYPEWLGAIAAAGGSTPELKQGGDFQIFDVGTEAGRRKLESQLSRLDREHAQEVTVTDELPLFLRAHCRLERPKILHFPAEAYVNNRELLGALRDACRRMGVAFIHGAAAMPWESRNGATRFLCGTTEVAARQVLLAAGAWSAKILEALGIKAPMVPVKGQMMRIKSFHIQPCMIHFNDDLYLVPRDGDLVVGATTEAGEWDERFDAKGETYLAENLRHFAPDVAAQPLETWTGLRSRTRDRLPWMGWLDASRGWALCAGHYKSGISMAPLAAQSMSKLLNGEKSTVDLDPFNPWRKQGLSR
jgi:glycine oxidase